MKRLICVAMMLAIAACATPSAHAQDDKCISATVPACTQAIAKYFDTDHTYGDEPAKIDVNGKPIGVDNTVLIMGHFHGDTSRSKGGTIDLTKDANGNVKGLTVTLPSSPHFAKTEDEYAATRLFEAASLALGSDCPLLGKPVTLFRFFENTVKPTIHSDGLDREVDWEHATESTSYLSKQHAVCGAYISFQAQIGHDTKYISLPDNEDGYYSIFIVSFMTPAYAKEQERFTAKPSRARHRAKK